MAIAPGWCPVGHPRGHGGLGDDWGSGGRRGWGVWSCVASTGGGASGGAARGPQAAARRASARAWMAGADAPEPDLDAVVDR